MRVRVGDNFYWRIFSLNGGDLIVVGLRGRQQQWRQILVTVSHNRLDEIQKYFVVGRFAEVVFLQLQNLLLLKLVKMFLLMFSRVFAVEQITLDAEHGVVDAFERLFILTRDRIDEVAEIVDAALSSLLRLVHVNAWVRYVDGYRFVRKMLELCCELYERWLYSQAPEKIKNNGCRKKWLDN